LTIANADGETILTPRFPTASEAANRTDNPSGGTHFAGATHDVLKFSGDVTSAELLTAAGDSNTSVALANSTLTGNQFRTNVFRVRRDIYIAPNCNLAGLRNVTIELGNYSIYIAPGESSQDTLWRNVQFRMAGNRTQHLRWVFREESGYKADGGGFIHTPTGTDGTVNGYKSVLYTDSLNNVELRAEEHTEQEIDAVIFLKKGIFNGIRGTRVKRITSPGDLDSMHLRYIFHDCDFSSKVYHAGTQIGLYNNASMILNDCELTAYPGHPASQDNQWLDTYHAPGVTKRACHLYLMGGTASKLSNTWSKQNESGRNELVQLHSGSLKYFQVLRGATPETNFHYRVYSTRSGTTAKRKSTPNTTDADMLNDIADGDPVHASSHIDVAIIKKDIIKEGSSWNERVYTDHKIRIRKPDMMFLDYAISEADSIISQGRPGNRIPLVVQPDTEYIYHNVGAIQDTGNTFYTFDFTNRQVTMPHDIVFSPERLYSVFKQVFSRLGNFDHSFPITYSNGILNLGDWNLLIGNNAVIESPGTQIRTTGTIGLGTGVTTSGVTLIDSTGVSVSFTCDYEGARMAIATDQNDPPTFQYLEPGAGETRIRNRIVKVPLNTTVYAVGNAPGRIYQTYAFSTNTTTSLDVRLPIDTVIDLQHNIPSGTLEKFSLSYTRYQTGVDNTPSLDISIGGTSPDFVSLNLYGQVETSKRVIDMLFLREPAMYYLLEYYIEELSDFLTDPNVFGRNAILFANDRIRFDSNYVHFIKTSPPNRKARIGIPWYHEGDQPYEVEEDAANTTGYVIFDRLSTIADIDRQLLTDTVETITTDDTYLDRVGSAQLDQMITVDGVTKPWREWIQQNTDLIEEIDDGLKMRTDTIGFFQVDHMHPWVGGGLGNELLELRGTNVHPHQLAMIRRTPAINAGRYHPWIDHYDTSGIYDGGTSITGTSIPESDSQYTINCAAIDHQYLFLGVTTSTGVHYICRLPTTSSGTAQHEEVSQKPIGMAINGARVAFVTERTSNPTGYDIRDIDYDLTETTHPIRYSQPVVGAIEEENIGMGIIGEDTDRELVVIAGNTRFIHVPSSYAYVSTTPLGFTACLVVWWQDHAWTIRKRDSTHWYLQPFQLESADIIRTEYLHAEIKRVPRETVEYQTNISRLPTGTFGRQIAQLPASVWNTGSGVEGISTMADYVKALPDRILDHERTINGSSTARTIRAMLRRLEIENHDIHDSVVNEARGSFGESVINRLTALGSRLTSVRAGYLDNLEHGVSGLTPEQTAALERIDVPVSSRLSSSDYIPIVSRLGQVLFNTPERNTTYVAGFLKGTHASRETRALLFQASNGNIKESQVYIDDGFSIIGSPTQFSDTETLIAVASSPTHNWYLFRGTTNMVVLEDSDGNRAAKTITSQQAGRKTISLLSHDDTIMYLNAKTVDSDTTLEIEWRTSQFDTGITVTDTTKVAAASTENRVYMLIGTTLHIFDVEGTYTFSNHQTSTLEGDTLLTMHRAVYVYNAGRIWPLDHHFEPVDIEWAVSQRKDLDNKIRNLPTSATLIGLTNSITNLPSSIKTTMEGTPGTLDKIHTAMTRNGTYNHDDDINTPEIDTLRKVVEEIPTSGWATSDDIPSAEDNATYLRDSLDFDDDDTSETSLKETIIALGEDLDALLAIVGADEYNSNTTILKRVKDIETRINTLWFKGESQGTKKKLIIDEAGVERTGGVLDDINNQTKQLRFTGTADSDGTKPLVTNAPDVASIRMELEGDTHKLSSIKTKTDQLRFSGTADANGTKLLDVDAHEITINEGQINVNIADLETKIDRLGNAINNTGDYDNDGNSNTAQIKTLRDQIDGIKNAVDKLPVQGMGTNSDPYLVKATIGTAEVNANVKKVKDEVVTGFDQFKDKADITDLSNDVTRIKNELTTQTLNVEGVSQDSVLKKIEQNNLINVSTRIYNPEDSTERIQDEDGTDLEIYDIKDNEGNPTGDGTKAYRRVRRTAI